ncbi:genetic competence negative regulator [Bacillus freudenreichii]|nr:genetic competence negative regulator [Bacillus freudenreichii]
MKLERISSNKIKYSITFEELTKKGFLQDELLKDSFIWDVLFDEMLDEASRIYELNDFGAVSIEIFSLTSRELVLILTMEEEESLQESTVTEKPLSTDKNQALLFKFDEFEHIVLLAKRLESLNKKLVCSSLFSLEESYYLKIDDARDREAMESLCGEYGEQAGVTEAFVEDYGIEIIRKDAIPLINFHF